MTFDKLYEGLNVLLHISNDLLKALEKIKPPARQQRGGQRRRKQRTRRRKQRGQQYSKSCVQLFFVQQMLISRLLLLIQENNTQNTKNKLKKLTITTILDTGKQINRHLSWGKSNTPSNDVVVINGWLNEALLVKLNEANKLYQTTLLQVMKREFNPEKYCQWMSVLQNGPKNLLADAAKYQQQLIDMLCEFNPTPKFVATINIFCHQMTENLSIITERLPDANDAINDNTFEAIGRLLDCVDTVARDDKTCSLEKKLAMRKAAGSMLDKITKLILSLSSQNMRIKTILQILCKYLQETRAHIRIIETDIKESCLESTDPSKSRKVETEKQANHQMSENIGKAATLFCKTMLRKEGQARGIQSLRKLCDDFNNAEGEVKCFLLIEGGTLLSVLPQFGPKLLTTLKKLIPHFEIMNNDQLLETYIRHLDKCEIINIVNDIDIYINGKTFPIYYFPKEFFDHLARELQIKDYNSQIPKNQLTTTNLTNKDADKDLVDLYNKLATKDGKLDKLFETFTSKSPSDYLSVENFETSNKTLEQIKQFVALAYGSIEESPNKIAIKIHFCDWYWAAYLQKIISRDKSFEHIKNTMHLIDRINKAVSTLIHGPSEISQEMQKTFVLILDVLAHSVFTKFVRELFDSTNNIETIDFSTDAARTRIIEIIPNFSKAVVNIDIPITDNMVEKLKVILDATNSVTDFLQRQPNSCGKLIDVCIAQLRLVCGICRFIKNDTSILTVHMLDILYAAMGEILSKLETVIVPKNLICKMLDLIFDVIGKLLNLAEVIIYNNKVGNLNHLDLSLEDMRNLAGWEIFILNKIKPINLELQRALGKNPKILCYEIQADILDKYLCEAQVSYAEIKTMLKNPMPKSTTGPTRQITASPKKQFNTNKDTNTSQREMNTDFEGIVTRAAENFFKIVPHRNSQGRERPGIQIFRYLLKNIKYLECFFKHVEPNYPISWSGQKEDALFFDQGVTRDIFIPTAFLKELAKLIPCFMVHEYNAVRDILVAYYAKDNIKRIAKIITIICDFNPEYGFPAYYFPPNFVIWCEKTQSLIEDAATALPELVEIATQLEQIEFSYSPENMNILNSSEEYVFKNIPVHSTIHSTRWDTEKCKDSACLLRAQSTLKQILAKSKASRGDMQERLHCRNLIIQVIAYRVCVTGNRQIEDIENIINNLLAILKHVLNLGKTIQPDYSSLSYQALRSTTRVIEMVGCYDKFLHKNSWVLCVEPLGEGSETLVLEAKSDCGKTSDSVFNTRLVSLLTTSVKIIEEDLLDFDGDHESALSIVFVLAQLAIELKTNELINDREFLSLTPIITKFYERMIENLKRQNDNQSTSTLVHFMGFYNLIFYLKIHEHKYSRVFKSALHNKPAHRNRFLTNCISLAVAASTTTKEICSCMEKISRMSCSVDEYAAITLLTRRVYEDIYVNFFTNCTSIFITDLDWQNEWNQSMGTYLETVRHWKHPQYWMKFSMTKLFQNNKRHYLDVSHIILETSEKAIKFLVKLNLQFLGITKKMDTPQHTQVINDLINKNNEIICALREINTSIQQCIVTIELTTATKEITDSNVTFSPASGNGNTGQGAQGRRRNTKKKNGKKDPTTHTQAHSFWQSPTPTSPAPIESTPMVSQQENVSRLEEEIAILYGRVIVIKERARNNLDKAWLKRLPTPSRSTAESPSYFVHVPKRLVTWDQCAEKLSELLIASKTPQERRSILKSSEGLIDIFRKRILNGRRFTDQDRSDLQELNKAKAEIIEKLFPISHEGIKNNGTSTVFVPDIRTIHQCTTTTTNVRSKPQITHFHPSSQKVIDFSLSIDIGQQSQTLMDLLVRLDFFPFLVGGTVRDKLIELLRPTDKICATGDISDLDILISEHDKSLETLATILKEQGYDVKMVPSLRYPIIKIRLQDGQELEIGSFKKIDKNGRRIPNKTKPESTAEKSVVLEDAKLRDLWINACYYDCKTHTMFVPESAFADLTKKEGVRISIIPKKPLNKSLGIYLVDSAPSIPWAIVNDPGRIVRILRYTAKLNGVMDTEMEQALRNNHSLIIRLDPRRRLHELIKHMTHGIGFLGDAYDVRHILDLMRFLLPWSFLPRRWRSCLFRARPGQATRQICTSLIAEAFRSVHFPILPLVKRDKAKGLQFIPRNPRLFTPNDFDYSPYFEIIKYPFLGPDEYSSYRSLPWDQEGFHSDRVGDEYINKLTSGSKQKNPRKK